MLKARRRLNQSSVCFGMSVLSVCILLQSVISGCSLDNYGTVLAKVTTADGGYVVDTFALGAFLRTRSDDPGLSVGFDRRSYVFDSTVGPTPNPGWYYFAVPLPEPEALIVHTENYGIELRSRSQDGGFTLGYRATTVLANVPAGESTYRLISYLPEAPEETSILVCRGEWPCQ